MEVAALSPFGLASEETGILALLANYMRSRSHSPVLLRCNGIFSLCDRDAEANWRRGFDHCLRCMYEQSQIALWSEMQLRDLSQFLTPKDIIESKRWILGIPKERLLQARFENVSVAELCQASMRNRLGADFVQDLNEQNENLFRRLMMSSLRALMAAQAYVNQCKPYFGLLVGADDFISKSFLQVFNEHDVDCAILNWDLSARSVSIKYPGREAQFSCPLVYEDITAMRSDYQTWPREVISILDDILGFLELGSTQLKLPIAGGA